MTNREFIQRLKKARKWVEKTTDTMDSYVLLNACQNAALHWNKNCTFNEGGMYDGDSSGWLSGQYDTRTAALAVIDNSIAALQQPTEPK
jgi:hypothetical protein